MNEDVNELGSLSYVYNPISTFKNVIQANAHRTSDAVGNPEYFAAEFVKISSKPPLWIFLGGSSAAVVAAGAAEAPLVAVG